MPHATTMPYPMRTAQEKRDAYLARYTQLKAERSSWDPHWRRLAERVLPRAPRFFASDRNRAGQHKYGSILDNTATRSLRVLTAGLMAGLTSPARQWFKLNVPRPELNESHNVRMWLDDVGERMRSVFSRSNVYKALQTAYESQGVFGTSSTLVVADPDSVIHCYTMPIGEYCLQSDWRGKIVTVYREFQRSVGEVVREFGYENCSTQTQQNYEARAFETQVDILHVIEPRSEQDRKPGSPLPEHMPWTSTYIEIGGTDKKLLRESGYRRMRVLAPRWQTSGLDVYGISPAMEALGDVNQLQQEQLRKSQAIDYMTEPPLQVPHNVRQHLDRVLPGGIQYFEPGTTVAHDQTTPNGGVRPAFEVRLQLSDLLSDIEDVRMRIKRAFFEDMFLMIAHADKNGLTATEVIERQEEKLLMIGPVVENLTTELLEPLISITFDDMLEAGLIPPPPAELEGVEMTVEFVSILAQAQRAVGITGVQQWVTDVIAVASSGVEAAADVADNVNFDEWARTTARMRGAPAAMLSPEDAVTELRNSRAAAQAAQEQAAMMAQNADTVNRLSQSPISQGTALDAALNTVAPVPV